MTQTNHPQTTEQECRKQRRNSIIITLPFFAIAIFCLLRFRGDIQIIATFFFLMFFMMFFGMSLAYDGIMYYIKKKNT